MNNQIGVYTRKVLDDGILYTTTGEKVQADIVLKDKYFDTTMSNMMLNPKDYLGKTVEVEGMYFENLPYMFVGRYSLANLCADCPEGISYIEYQLDEKIDETFEEEKTWIKVIGTFSEGQDNGGTEEDPYYYNYYYLKVINLEIMNERGQDTVSN